MLYAVIQSIVRSNHPSSWFHLATPTQSIFRFEDPGASCTFPKIKRKAAAKCTPTSTIQLPVLKRNIGAERWGSTRKTACYEMHKSRSKEKNDTESVCKSLGFQEETLCFSKFYWYHCPASILGHAPGARLHVSSIWRHEAQGISAEGQHFSQAASCQDCRSNAKRGFKPAEKQDITGPNKKNLGAPNLLLIYVNKPSLTLNSSQFRPSGCLQFSATHQVPEAWLFIRSFASRLLAAMGFSDLKSARIPSDDAPKSNKH